MSDHIAAHDLAAYADGALAGEPRAEVESHLSRCGECLEALAEIVDIRDRAEKVPGEFLRRALGEMPGAAAVRPPLRLAFGIAAVFLVVVLIGYHLLDRGRAGTAGITEDGVPLPAAAVKESRRDVHAHEAAKAREEMPRGALPGREDRRARGGGDGAEKKLAAGQVEPAPPAAPVIGDAAVPAALPGKAELQQMSGEADMALPRETEGVEAGGVLGEAAAPPGKDKENAMKLASARQAPAARAEELSYDDALFPGKAAAAGMAQRSRSARPGVPAQTRQLFLVVTGRAAAPLAIGDGAWQARPAVRVTGDVSGDELDDPGLLDSWSWFPAGLALELVIDEAGTVTEVNPVGPWDDRLAARAQTAARELRFRASGKKNRRAVLSLPAPPN